MDNNKKHFLNLPRTFTFKKKFTNAVVLYNCLKFFFQSTLIISAINQTSVFYTIQWDLSYQTHTT